MQRRSTNSPSADGVVSVVGIRAKKVSYANLIGGKHFNVKITATGTGGAMIVAPEVQPKDHKDYKIVGTSVPRVDLPPKFTGEFVVHAGRPRSGHAPWTRGAPAGGEFQTLERR